MLRPLLRIALLLATSLLLVSPVQSAEAPHPNKADAPPSNDGVWITLGADAFATLGDLSFEHRPLQSHAASAGVVLTRVHGDDIPLISRRFHERFQRCSGFLAHRDLEDAQAALEAAKRTGLVGAPIDYLIDRPDLVNALDPLFEAEPIREVIERLSTDFVNRYYQYASGEAAALYLRDLWQGFAQNRPDVTVELVDHSWLQPSVMLTIPGGSLAHEEIVLGGHLDSITFDSGNPNFVGPGADDNASGIATLSEVIRVALAQGYYPDRTVRFVGYAAEEVGLLGSQEIARASTGVVAVLQYDMTALNGSVEDFGVLSDFTDPQLTAFVIDLIATYLPEYNSISTACGYGCSDHASWHAEGIPVAMAFESRFGQHNGAIHTPSDTLATLGNSADHALKFARLASAFMVELASGELSGLSRLFADGFESGTWNAWSATQP